MSVLIKRRNKGTDNSHLGIKQCVRLEACQGLAEVNVLDAFCGSGRLWKSLPHNTYLGIDKERKGAPNAICGDNIKIIPTLDLSQYNVIDLDAYGMPVVQIMKVLDNPTVRDGSIIIYTAISSAISAISHQMLDVAHIPVECYTKCPMLWAKHGAELYFRILAGLGVKVVHDCEVDDGAYKKHYGYFVLRKNPKNGIICDVSPEEDKPKGNEKQEQKTKGKTK